MLDSIHTLTHTTYISISSLRGWKIKRLFTHTRQQQMAHKNYSGLSRPATVTPKKKFFFFSHTEEEEVTHQPGARSARSASQQSRVIAAVHILLLLLYTAKDISPSALQRKRLPFYFGRPLFVRDLASHFHLIPQANTSSFYSSLVTRRGGRSSKELLAAFLLF
jgi:hypothetical protein